MSAVMKSIVIYAFVVVAQEDNFLLFMRAPVAKVNCIASTVGLCVSRLQSHRSVGSVAHEIILREH